MKKKSIVLVLVLAIMSSLAAFSPDTELVPPGHWIYDALDYLYADSGEADIAVSAPASHFEIRTHLDAISLDLLSPQGAALYRKVLSAIGERVPVAESGVASFDTRPVASLSARYRTTNDVFFTFDHTSEFNATKPLVVLPLELCFTPYVTGYSEFSVGEGYMASGFLDNYTNIPNAASWIDMNWPRTAYIAAGNSFCTAVLGRGAIAYGRTLSGSMLVSGDSDRNNYASLSMFAPRVRYTMLPVEISPNRFAYYHNLTMKPLSFLSITLSEASLVNSTLDPRYLNPYMVFHSYSGWLDRPEYGYYQEDEDITPVGSQFGGELSIVPLRGLKLYGQFVMNQFQTSYEMEKWKDAAAKNPNALGGTAGIRYAIPLWDGFLSASVEGVYTNPWLYIMNNKNISWYWSRHELLSPVVAKSDVSGWLGSPYGPDTAAWVASFRYEDIGNLEIGATYRFVCRGENGDKFLAFKETTTAKRFYPSTMEEASITTPSGQASYQHLALVEVSKHFGEHLEISGSLGYAAMSGKVNAGTPLCGLGVTWSVR
jgi:hypothetical protein